MKGPGMRLDLDVRRHWRCGVCGAERRTPGKRTVVTCHVCKDDKLMSLVEPQRPPRAIPEPLDMLIDLHPDDVDVPAVTEVESAPIVEEPTVQKETSESPAAELAEATAPQKSKRKKRPDRKRSRRRTRSKSQEHESATDEASDKNPPSPQSSPRKTSSPSPPPSDSFGDGL